MPKLRKLKYKQRGGVKVSLRQPDGNYVATDVDLTIINAIFQNCIDTYLISASSASGTVFGVALPQPGPGVAPPILLRANQLNPDVSVRTQDQLADRGRFVGDGLIIPDCCIKMSFVRTTSRGHAHVTVIGYKKQICEQSDLDKEVRVQGEIFSSTLCGTTAPLTFTPDKIAAATMTAVEFGMIVEALAARTLNPNPRVARAIGMLRAIQLGARARNLRIHIFVMDLLRGETLRTIITRPGTLQEKIDACNNVAISVIMTFLKSLYWSRDQHADNAMISGLKAFTLDHGLMYHLLTDEGYIKDLLARLLKSISIKPDVVCNYFGVAAPAAAASAAFNELYDMLRNPNLKELMLINLAADSAAEINRISEIVFRMLSFFLLVDGLSNRYKHQTHHFQSREYMEVVFDSVSALNSFEDFLNRGSINLSVFGGPPGSASIVRANMAHIVQGLQPALAICPSQGPARIRSTLRLSSQSSSSPGELAYNAAIQQARSDEVARRRSEAAASAVPGRLSRLKSAVTGAVTGAANAGIARFTKWWWPNLDDLDGGTVKRRVRAQKRQKQTMRRSCNIRRQRRRSFNKILEKNNIIL